MKRRLAWVLAFVLAGVSGLRLSAAVTGQWDFDTADLSATVGSALQFRGTTASQTQFGSTTSFGIASIGGEAAQVMRFPACSPAEGFLMPHGAAPNGSGSRVNQYTLVMDVFFPSTSTGFRSFWQTETDNPLTTDGELFVNAANGLGISGQYQGNLTPDVWHRVVFTFDLTQRELGKYIDGTNVLTGPVGAAPLGANPMQYLSATTGGVDQRWSLGPTAMLFADENNETGVGYVNSIQFHDRVLSAAEIGDLGGPAAGGIPPGTNALPGGIAQYDFNGDLTSTVGGPPLGPSAAAPAGIPGLSFVNTDIGGQTAQAASFTRGTFFYLTNGLAANGGGSLLNQYTLLLDVMFPSRPTGWAVLYQTNPNNTEDGEWFINPAQGIGISGNYGGFVADGSWHRLGLVVDTVAGSFTSYLNGAPVQQNTGLSVDGRWAIAPVVLLFADEDQENAAGLVNSVQLRPEALPASDLLALGGPAATGIPPPSPPTFQLLSPNGGESFQAGSLQLVTWVATNASGLVRLDLYRGDTFQSTLARVPLRQTNYPWAIAPSLGDTNNYRLKLTSLSFPSVSDVSDAAFAVFGSAPPPNPLFGQPLQTNGGFELLLSSWQTIAGGPSTLTAADGKGSPYAGTRFFFGGFNPGGDAVIRQDVDLLEAGFLPAELDEGSALEATAWLRNRYGAGTFDDQVFYRVAYLDSQTNEIASLRCMVAGTSVWVQRALYGLLPPGTRKLRVEIVGKHRRDADNDSLADELMVRLQKPFPLSNPQITKLPMLQDVRRDAMTMLWETDSNLAHHFVDWGRTNVAEHTLTNIETLQIDGSHFVHRARLAGLEAETSYFYRVRSGTNVSEIYSFRTAPRPETPFVVAWWGDNHGGTTTLRTHIANLQAHAPDLVAVAGDNVNNGNALNEWHDYWFKPLEHLNLAQTTPVIYARGNHDGEHALAYAYSALPGNESWFAFDYGNSRFIFLDSEASTSVSPEQYQWLRNELQRPETQRAAFRIVCFHRLPYANLWNGGGYTGETWVRNDWVPLFASNNVDLVISGHGHNYNRGASNGVTYIVSGGGGGAIDTEVVANWPLYTVQYSQHHFDIMEVMGHSLTWQTFNNNNVLLDLFTLQSRVPVLAWSDTIPAGGVLPLILRGKPGVSYLVEGSANMIAWSTIATNTIPAAGPPWITNSVPTTNALGFFRARALP